MSKQLTMRLGCLVVGALGPLGCASEVASDPGLDIPSASATDALKCKPDRTLPSNT